MRQIRDTVRGELRANDIGLHSYAWPGIPAWPAPEPRVSRPSRRQRRVSGEKTTAYFTTSHLAWRETAPFKTGSSRLRSPVLLVSPSSTRSDIGNWVKVLSTLARIELP